MNETMIDTSEVLTRYKIKRYWLWVWTKMGKLTVKRDIVNGRAKNTYLPTEIERLMKEEK